MIAAAVALLLVGYLSSNHVITGIGWFTTALGVVMIVAEATGHTA